MKHASKGSWLFSLVVLGLILSCLSGPKAPPEAKAPQPAPPAAVPAAATAPAQAPAPPSPAIPPQVSDTRHKPLPSSVLVLSLPEPALPSLPAVAPVAAIVPPPASSAPAPGPSLAAPALPKASPPASPQPSPPPAPLPAKPAPKPEAPKPAPKPEAPKAEAAKAPDTTKGSTLPPPGPASTIQAQAIPSERKPDIARKVTVDLGQRIELPFEGSGWTYLGEAEGREGILYESRRYEGPGLTFVLNPSKVGDFVLRFQREDLLRGMTNEELVAVHVNPKPIKLEALPAAAPGTGSTASTASTASPGTGPTGTAPPGPAIPAKPAPTATPATPATPAAPLAPTPSTPGTSAMPGSVASPGAAPTVPGTAVTALPQAQASSAFALSLPDSPEGLLQAARKELLAGRVPGSLAALDRFLALYPEGMDEVYYLYGLSLEQNGDSKDIKRAYASYKKLVDTWPESQFWDQAKARMAFLERHYFTIR